MTTAQDISRKQKMRFEARRADPRLVNGIPYGFPTLDSLTGGIQTKQRFQGEVVGENDLVTLIGDSNSGKSSIAGQVGRMAAEWFLKHKPDRDVRFISLEMGDVNLQDRMAASLSGVPLTRIQTGMYLDDEQARRYHQAVDILGSLPIQYITDVPTMKHLCEAVGATREGVYCGLWILDHFNMTPGIDVRSEASSLNAVATTLQRLARKVAPGLVLAQMNREAQKREDKRPRKSDLLYGTTMITASDVVLGLYRESMYNLTRFEVQNGRGKEAVDFAELSVLKNRNRGGLGVIDVDFYADRGVWIERERS